MDRCNICGKESDDMLGFEISDDFTLFICDDCIEYMQNGGRLAKIQTPDKIDNPELNAAVSKWFEYKAERGNRYTDNGRQALLSRIANEAKRTSDAVVIKKIELSIEKKWRGIAWDVGIVPTETIDSWFENTFALSPNQDGKAIAQKRYRALFQRFDDENEALARAREIYKAFRIYLDKLNDTKYCKSFSKWLNDEIPLEWRQ